MLSTDMFKKPVASSGMDENAVVPFDFIDTVEDIVDFDANRLLDSEFREDWVSYINLKIFIFICFTLPI